jgi:endonuclease YncB( thermonuclease family)
MRVRHAIEAILVIACLAGTAWLLQPSGRTVEGFARVIDGDSLEIGTVEVRLRGVDAPELHQTCTHDGKPYRCGEVSRAALAGLIAGQPIQCKGNRLDRYQRLLVRCFFHDQDIGGWLVAQGHAVGYGGYEPEEARARRAAIGLWAGEFDLPADWRQLHRFSRP